MSVLLHARCQGGRSRTGAGPLGRGALGGGAGQPRGGAPVGSAARRLGGEDGAGLGWGTIVGRRRAGARLGGAGVHRAGEGRGLGGTQVERGRAGLRGAERGLRSTLSEKVGRSTVGRQG